MRQFIVHKLRIGSFSLVLEELVLRRLTMIIQSMGRMGLNDSLRRERFDAKNVGTVAALFQNTDF